MVAPRGKTKLIRSARDAVGWKSYVRTTVCMEYKLQITNRGKDLRTPICGYIIFLLVVFGIVPRILDLSCDIFGIYRYQYREYVRDISTPISCDISHDIDTIWHVLYMHHK